ncbi:MAG: hypothetical protein Q8S00_26415 [Deltaproteobacteria bacterium]|nr:hypothetical protein [Deltaproteobacteria bacterium]
METLVPPQHENKPHAKDPAPDTCGHCPELDRLVRVMAGVERELIIIVRALCNGTKR